MVEINEVFTQPCVLVVVKALPPGLSGIVSHFPGLETHHEVTVLEIGQDVQKQNVDDRVKGKYGQGKEKVIQDTVLCDVVLDGDSQLIIEHPNPENKAWLLSETTKRGLKQEEEEGTEMMSATDSEIASVYLLIFGSSWLMETFEKLL